MKKQDKLRIMVIDTIKPGMEDVIDRIMTTKLQPAVRKQIPEFRATTYRPVIGKLCRMVLIAEVTPEQALNYDQWIIDALEKEHGKEEVAKYLKEWYSCLDSTEYVALVEDERWSFK